MKQSCIADYSNDFIISATLKHDIKQTILHEPRQSIYQIAQSFNVEPSDVIKVYEELRSGN